MTIEELTAYFDRVTLPENLRLDRASTQLNVADRVKQLLASMTTQPENWRHRHQLLGIRNALENPYTGPEIPRF